ncbi:MAG: histone deacetylase family protein [bacterium]|nr:histone deacetylase family protein [bacterium]
MKVVCTDAETQSHHAPAEEFGREGLIPYPECPRRYDVIQAALQSVGWTSFVAATDHDDGLLSAVHDADYIAFLRGAYTSWIAAGGVGDLVASVFSGSDGRAPTNTAAATGFYGFDTTPLTAGTWAATRAAAHAALTAADQVAAGDSTAYALCRPPGHHASRNRFGGYCYLNHAALAAQSLAATGSVAIVDIDYHHGNGTQQIFYDRDDVFFVSLHADPEWEYPLFWGRADETGAGDGVGCTLNVPLPAGVDDAGYLAQLAAALQPVRAFNPRYLVVSAGFDTWRHDPLGTFALTADGITRVGASLAELALPTVIVQEGGYDVDTLGDLVAAFLRPFC